LLAQNNADNKNIFKRTIMTPDEYQWNVSLVKDRYQTLNLTFEQAALVYKFEKEKTGLSNKHYFSAWEEWDYDLFFFKKILSPEQFSIFEQEKNKAIENYRLEEIRLDANEEKEIELLTEQVKYYKEQFLPDFFSHPVCEISTSFWNDKAKIDLLRTEYKSFSADTKKFMLTQHFRHYRTCKPNQLEAALLWHKLSYLWPDYFSFKAQMDFPTKTIAEYIEQKVKHVYKVYDDFVKNKLEALRTYNRNSFERHYGDMLHNSNTFFTKLSNPDDVMENRAMCVVLLDKDYYGLGGY
jgi:hypothetical protein